MLFWNTLTGAVLILEAFGFALSLYILKINYDYFIKDLKKRTHIYLAIYSVALVLAQALVWIQLFTKCRGSDASGNLTFNCDDVSASPQGYMVASVFELMAVYTMGVFFEYYCLQKYESFKNSTSKLTSVLVTNAYPNSDPNFSFYTVLPYKKWLRVTLRYMIPIVALIDFIAHAAHTIFGWDFVTTFMVLFDVIFWGSCGIFDTCICYSKILHYFRCNSSDKSDEESRESFCSCP